MARLRLVDRVYGWAARDGEREALVVEGQRLTYAQLADRIQQTAHALRRAGLRPGARVAFLGGPGAAFLISELATHAAGGTWLGLNPRYTSAELSHVLSDATPDLIVVDVEHATEAIGAALARMDRPPTLQPLATLGSLADVPRLAECGQALTADIALLVYTSGTTGIPKGAMLTHAGMDEASALYAGRYGHEGMRTLLNLPINHVGSLVDLCAPTLREGGALIAMTGFDPIAIPDVLREERISMLGQVPAMHLAIEAAGGYDPESLPHLRHLAWSGAAMPRSWVEPRVGSRVQLSTCYGLTECTGSVTFSSVGASVEDLTDTVGRPAHPGLVRIAHPDGSPVPVGEPGEVQVRGVLVMAGYLGRPDATADATTKDGWLRTGDLGVLHESGLLSLVGRLKEMFKSGGYNIYPREIEVALEEHPAVAAAAVIGMPDSRWQEVGWAFVMTRRPVTSDELDAHARERLANYKAPKKYILREDLPLLPIGKIDKRALREAALACGDG